MILRYSQGRRSLILRGRQDANMMIGSPHEEDGTLARGDRLETQRLLDEARRMLDKTRAFLKQVTEGDEASRLYLEGLKGNLENDVRRLESKRLVGDESPAEPEPEK